VQPSSIHCGRMRLDCSILPGGRNWESLQSWPTCLVGVWESGVSNHTFILKLKFQC
jgi:hypothetical protein